MSKPVSKSTREILLRQKLKSMGYSADVVDKYANDLIKKFKIDLGASLTNLYQQINKLSRSEDFNMYMNNKHSIEFGPDAPKPRIYPAPAPPSNKPDEPELRTRPLPTPFNTKPH